METIMAAYAMALSRRITPHDFVAPSACLINHSNAPNVDIALGDGRMRIAAKGKIDVDQELLTCYTNKADDYFLVNYGVAMGRKELNCIEMTCQQIVNIMHDKVPHHMIKCASNSPYHFQALFQKNEFNSTVKDDLAKWAAPRATQTCVLAPTPSIEYDFAVKEIATILCEVSIISDNRLKRTMQFRRRLTLSTSEL